MLLFREDTTSISHDCEKAEKMAELAMTTIRIFEEMMALVAKKQQDQLRLQSMSIARKRWSTAIRKVIMQNKVEKMTVFIDDYYNKIAKEGFVFKLPAQVQKKQKPRKKEFSPDFQNQLLLIEKELKKTPIKHVEISKEPERLSSADGDVRTFLPMKVQPIARRKSLTVNDELVCIVKPHVKDEHFSNLSRNANRVVESSGPDSVSTATGTNTNKERESPNNGGKNKITSPINMIGSNDSNDKTPMKNKPSRRGSFISPPPLEPTTRKSSLPRLSSQSHIEVKSPEVSQSVRLSPAATLPAIQTNKQKRRNSINN